MWASIIVLGFFALIVALIIMYWQFSLAAVVIGLVLYWVVKVLPGVRLRRRRDRYFRSEEFLRHKAEIESLVQEHNDITEYANELRSTGKFQLGQTDVGKHSELAEFENTSKHNYQRDRNTTDYSASNVYNCSLQVVRNAKKNPLKYVMKYFGISATEDRLEEVEELGEKISRLEGAVGNLERREENIATAINPPDFILEHFRDEFMEEVGVELAKIDIPYQTYAFEYVSAGGNSSQTTSIKLDARTIDALIEEMSEKIKFRKSAAGQRALMTATFRNFIKSRDSFTCQICDLSISDEPNLLLEVDHIVPVSRGGLSQEENLQTLCWRCNRSKSNKILPEKEDQLGL